MNQQATRIDGWKSIAGYLGRDRSTVIRWANERGLPVRSLPGGKSRTVYALKDELDAWMRSERLTLDPVADDATAISEGSLASVAVDAASLAPRRSWRVAGAVAALVVLIVLAFVTTRAVPQAQVAALTPTQQATLLQARDDIAARSADRLSAAIDALQSLRSRAPANPDVHEALAEGYLLNREFGSLPDALSLGKARREAATTLELRPRSSTALRVLGVVTYWWDRDPAAAGKLFRRATDAAPDDALAHHWYANILADNGEHAAAQREFDMARRLSPGAPYLIADYAWALWSAGRTDEAVALLDKLVDAQPMLASAHDCLSVIAFAAGDLRGYARHLRLRAEARAAPELTAYGNLIGSAVARGDRAAVYGAMFTRALAQAESTSESDHSWPAFVASCFGDRTQLVDVLRRSQRLGERWGASGYTQRIGERWRTDPEVRGLLAALRQPRIEPMRSDATV